MALLVWGDPSLYDSTLRILDHLAAGGLAFARRVVPGITSLQALAARHGIAAQRDRRAGSRHHRAPAARECAGGRDSIAVMLDGGGAFRAVPAEAFDIWWGAYLGMEQEVVVAGPLAEVGDRIVELREAARAANGWIMDTYLLRRR